MRVKSKKQLQILTVSDREPEVVRLAGESAVVRVFFNVDATAALEADVISCNFRVLPTQPMLKSKQSLGALDSAVALNSPTTRKLAAQNRQATVVVRGNVDITKSIPNDRVRQVVGGDEVRTRKVLKIADQGEDDSVDSPDVESSTAAQAVKNTNSLRPYRLDLMNLNSKDPAEEVNLAQFHKPVQSSIRGFRSVDNLSKLSIKQHLFRKSVSSKTGTVRRLKMEDEVERSLEIPCTFQIEKSRLSRYVIEVDAISRIKPESPPNVLQTISFNVDLREAYEEFIIPTIPPKLDISSIGSARFIRATQRDRNGKSVRIYRRIIETTESNQEPFMPIAEIRAGLNETVQFVDRPESAGKCIYRAVPMNEISVTSGEFSSSVTRGNRVVERGRCPDTTAILASEDTEGVRVRVFGIPNDVIAVRILRRSLSLYESELTTPNTIQTEKTKLIQQLDRAGESVEFRDRPARSGIVYEYFVDLIDAKGNDRRSAKSSILRYVGDSGRTGSYRLVASSQVASLDPNPKISFQVEAPNDESSLDILYDLLSNAGLDTQYVDEIKQNRELFSKIAALEMLRFDTVTGLNESFGVVQTGVFEDSGRSRSSKNVSTPIQGRTYIYQFRLLLRASSTLFDSATVINTDLETGRQYTTAMKKFNSPRVLNKGTLASTASQLNVKSKTGLKLGSDRSSEGEMIEGITSLVGEVQITIPARDTSLTDVRVESTPRGNVIRWKVNQGLQTVDHIIVFADYNGSLAPLRAIHFVDQANLIYLDDRIAAPLDTIGYYLQPVFVNFSEGALAGPAEF
jgi:hypothetical protein